MGRGRVHEIVGTLLWVQMVFFKECGHSHFFISTGRGEHEYGKMEKVWQNDEWVRGGLFTSGNIEMRWRQGFFFNFKKK